MADSRTSRKSGVSELSGIKFKSLNDESANNLVFRIYYKHQSDCQSLFHKTNYSRSLHVNICSNSKIYDYSSLLSNKDNDEEEEGERQGDDFDMAAYNCVKLIF